MYENFRMYVEGRVWISDLLAVESHLVSCRVVRAILNGPLPYAAMCGPGTWLVHLRAVRRPSFEEVLD